MLKRKIEDLNYWVRSHITERYHLVDTGLKPQYYDKDTLMLHAAFNLLKQFVEIECSHMYWLCYEGGSTSLWRKIRTTLFGRTYLKPEWGLLYLSKQTGFADDNSYEVLVQLYDWWVNKRPNRFDPYDDPKAAAKFVADYLTWPADEDAVKERKLTQGWSDIMKVERHYENEDQRMFIRLVKLRKMLWT